MNFILIASSLLIGNLLAQSNQRPTQKKFESEAIEKTISRISEKMKDNKLKYTFINSFPNTLDTTVTNYDPNVPDAFVITGDITAMWLRDSTNQLWTYMEFVNKDSKLQNLIKGAINRQINQVLIDPYANAFNYQKKQSEWSNDNTTRCFLGVNVHAMSQHLHERKFEIDSLVAVLRLVVGYYKETNDTSIINFKYLKAVQRILRTFKDQQADQTEQFTTFRFPYTFQRNGRSTDTVINGIGEPLKRTGLLRTFFRASDDSTVYQFNIPENAMASAILKQTAEMLSEAQLSWSLRKAAEPLIQEAFALSSEIRDAIYKYGIKDGAFVYEVDGMGKQVFMDDSNQPSLLSLPIYGFIEIDDPLYQATRKKALSSANPYYFEGTAAKGIGGPHIGTNYIWPMAIVTQGLTTNDKQELRECLRMLVTTTGNKWFMHESFFKDNPSSFTRSWFAWANGLFGELVLKIDKEYPELLEENYS
ncbi:unnamed protein product [Paramecium pentaurelia]|uniref:Glycoside hydrolase family 125 protein n=1 Tax=Paramecium pentaurelia TaxID=43138 RepID=A0A8S1TY16_9CILI|nr:unnamed protein product [Paramecium pentaurelia]